MSKNQAVIKYVVGIRVPEKMAKSDFFLSVNSLNGFNGSWVWKDGHYDLNQRVYNLVIQTTENYPSDLKRGAKDKIMELCKNKGLLYYSTNIL